jgi:hypothetical protein
MAHSAQTTTQWQILDTVGPVFSNGGLKNWDLCLARDADHRLPQELLADSQSGHLCGPAKSGGDAAVVGQIRRRLR